MTTAPNLVQTPPRTSFLKAVENVFAALAVLVVCVVTAGPVYFIARWVTAAAILGDFLPLLGVIGTASVVFVGWKIVSPSRGKR